MNYLIARTIRRPKCNVVSFEAYVGISILKLSDADTLIHTLSGACVVKDSNNWNNTMAYSILLFKRHYNVSYLWQVPYQDDLL